MRGSIKFTRVFILAGLIVFALIVTACPTGNVLLPGGSGGGDTGGGSGGTGGGGSTTSVAFSGLTANGSGSTTTTQLTLTFDVDPTSLTAEHITVTGATKGTLSGTGTTRTLGISHITVADGGSVTVAIANPSGFTITNSSRDVVVSKAVIDPQIKNDNGNDTSIFGGTGGGTLYSRGVGQTISYSQPYVPEKFSVNIWAAVTGGSLGDLTLNLRIWAWDGTTATSTIYGSSTLTVPKTTTGPIEFTITDGARIPANTQVLYAVYLSDAVSRSLTTGTLRIRNSDVYNGGHLVFTLNQNDTTVSQAANWNQKTTTYDLVFTLTGVVVD